MENPFQLEDNHEITIAETETPGSVFLNRLGGLFQPRISQNISSVEKVFPFTGTTMTCVNQNQKQRSPTKSLSFNNITLYLPSMEERLLRNCGDISLESLLDSFVKGHFMLKISGSLNIPNIFAQAGLFHLNLRHRNPVKSYPARV